MQNTTGYLQRCCGVQALMGQSCFGGTSGTYTIRLISVCKEYMGKCNRVICSYLMCKNTLFLNNVFKIFLYYIPLLIIQIYYKQQQVVYISDFLTEKLHVIAQMESHCRVHTMARTRRRPIAPLTRTQITIGFYDNLCLVHKGYSCNK